MIPSESLQETLSMLPALPGVYQMWDKEGTIIYIGKARVLQNRVRSYFSGRKDTKTTFLVQHVVRITWIVTGSEYEALILENNLIKEHTPRYNINLKDDKTYPVIRITNEEYPRVFRTRRIINDGSSYFGPFTAVGDMDTYLDLVEKHFPLRKCKGPLKRRASPCLYHHIGRCTAPCAGLTTPGEYRQNVDAIKEMLKGRTAGLKRRLESRMKEQSAALHFEDAARTRDAIRALQTLGQTQQVQDFDTESRDYISWFQEEDRVAMVVFRMREGKLLGAERIRIHAWHDAEEEVESFLLQFYLSDLPSRIIVTGLEDPADMTRALKESTGCKTEIRPPRGKKDEAILGMARENARQELSRWKTETGDTRALEDLRQVLSLEKMPMRIEGFDVAQLQGKHTVTAMVSFWKGIPDRNHYRIFGIRSLDGAIDDYQSLREALARRYTRVLNEELDRPDLILIDGGKGQLHAATAILKILGLEEIPVCSLAKEDEEIYVPGVPDPLRLPEGSPALRILQAVRDEAHRFGTTRNQKLRSGDIRLETLESIPGIGPGRAKSLMQAFGSLEGIRKASPAGIHGTAGIPEKLARRVWEVLNAGSVEDSYVLGNQDSLEAAEDEGE